MNFRNYSSSWHYYANESNKIALLTYSSILLVRLNICLFLMLEIFPINILSLSKKKQLSRKKLSQQRVDTVQEFFIGDPL